MRIPGTPRTRAALVATASAALVLSPAAAHARAVDDTKLVPHTHFVMQADGSTGNTAKGAQIPNIDSVKATVRTYYNATGGVANKDFSPYITEMKGIEAEILKQLPNPAPAPQHGRRLRRRRHHALDLRHGGRGDALQLQSDRPER